MPGEECGVVSNMWYSFDYDLAHFVAMDGETDDVNSTEVPFEYDLTEGETFPLRNQTGVADAGPFGYINGSIYDIKAYEQYNWLAKDLVRNFFLYYIPRAPYSTGGENETFSRLAPSSFLREEKTLLICS
jgi:hypothetical protein